MNRSVSTLVGFMSLAATVTTGSVAHATLEWFPMTNAAAGGLTVNAADITVTAENVAYIIDRTTNGGIFYLDGTVANTWQRIGVGGVDAPTTITANFVSVDTDASYVFAFNNTTGTFWTDAVGQGWASEYTSGCITWLAQHPYFNPSAPIGEYVGIAGCGGTLSDNEFVSLSDVPGAAWSQVPGGGTQIAVSVAPVWQFSLWAINAEGFVYQYDPVGNGWVQTLGAEVTAITDHHLVGGDQSIWFWNDSAPNGVSGQVIPGNWEGPILWGLPNGNAIQMLAYQTKMTSSNLWAIDAEGNVFQAENVYIPR